MKQVELDFGPYCHSCGQDLSSRAYWIYNDKSYCGKNCVIFKEKQNDQEHDTHSNTLVPHDG